MANETENWVGFGLWVKARREARGWTQEDLAKRVGFSDRQTIYRIEGGASTKRSSIIKIAKALAEKPEVALAIVYGQPKTSEPDERAAAAERAAKLIENFLTLDTEKQDQILAIIDILRSDAPELIKPPIRLVKAEDLTHSDAEEDTG